MLLLADLGGLLSAAGGAEMVCSLRTVPLLNGFRYAPKRDVLALDGLLLRVTALAENLPR